MMDCQDWKMDCHRLLAVNLWAPSHVLMPRRQLNMKAGAQVCRDLGVSSLWDYLKPCEWRKADECQGEQHERAKAIVLSASRGSGNGSKGRPPSSWQKSMIWKTNEAGGMLRPGFLGKSPVVQLMPSRQVGNGHVCPRHSPGHQRWLPQDFLF